MSHCFSGVRQKRTAQNYFVLEKEGKLLPIGILTLLAASIGYLFLNSSIINHDPDNLAIDESFTFVSGLICSSYLLVLLFAAFRKKLIFLGFRLPIWFGKLTLSLAVLLIPIYFIELRLDVTSKEAARPIEAKRWFLAERTSSCRRRRSYFSHCKNRLYDYNFYDSKGSRFHASRYGDFTSYFCVLGQRLANKSGRQWLKVERIETLDYETDFNGRLTAKGKRQLVQCTHYNSEYSS